MSNYVCLLRGINVSGQKKIKMDALRTALSALGYADLQTYIQSGNVVFESSQSNTAILEAEIHQNIFENFGFDVPVMVRTLGQWKEAFEHNPFVNDRNEDISKLYVAFLSDVPSEENITVLAQHPAAPDEYVLLGQRVYFYCPNGAGRANIDNNILERKLKVKATSRNWKTVTQLMAMVSA